MKNRALTKFGFEVFSIFKTLRAYFRVSPQKVQYEIFQNFEVFEKNDQLLGQNTEIYDFFCSRKS